MSEDISVEMQIAEAQIHLECAAEILHAFAHDERYGMLLRWKWHTAADVCLDVAQNMTATDMTGD